MPPLKHQLESQLQLPRVVGCGDRRERGGAAVVVRRAEIGPVEQVECLERNSICRRATASGCAWPAAKSTCQKYGRRMLLRGALPNGWLGSVGIATARRVRSSDGARCSGAIRVAVQVGPVVVGAAEVLLNTRDLNVAATAIGE